MKSFILAGTSLIALAATTTAQAAGGPERPMFAVQPRLHPNVHAPLATTNWTFSYTYKGRTYNDVFIGTNPTGGASTTVPVYIIPINLKKSKKINTDPSTVLSNGKTVTQNTVASPIFQTGIDYVQGGTDIGNTQYIDAYQRASLWGTVSSHTGYHVLLGAPTVEPEQTIKVGANGTIATDFGVKVLNANINWFDGKIEPMLKKLKIPTNALPIFLITQTYLTSGGCCIGGYHAYTGTQAYSVFSYIQKPGVFSQDVSALSHEVAEWLDDPTTNNNSPCGIYENGDPLENTANYGDYPYPLGGFTYHLQDLATPVYFGAPTTTTVHGWTTFQGTSLAVCQNGS
ncbi:MAG: hypothetical protein WDN04_06620 [Rhodospirillales bacterium]